jgi:hypothetical protein
MKKFIFIFLLIMASSLFAQNVADENRANIYPVTVTVEKIYKSNVGYIVQYRKSLNTIGTVGIPEEWFSNAGGKAELINLPPGNSWPNMTIFYKDGEFSRLKLYVHKRRSHSTWGNIAPGTDVSRYFKDQDKFIIEY